MLIFTDQNHKIRVEIGPGWKLQAWAYITHAAATWTGQAAAISLKLGKQKDLDPAIPCLPPNLFQVIQSSTWSSRVGYLSCYHSQVHSTRWACLDGTESKEFNMKRNWYQTIDGETEGMIGQVQGEKNLLLSIHGILTPSLLCWVVTG